MTHQTPVTGSASFPLIMKSGNEIENTQPLEKIFYFVIILKQLTIKVNQNFSSTTKGKKYFS